MDRIVVGVDGTPESVAAARFASGLAGKAGFNLTLAYVVPSFAPLGSEEVLGQRLEWEQEEAERGRTVLRDMTAAFELPEAGLVAGIARRRCGHTGGDRSHVDHAGRRSPAPWCRRPHAPWERRRSPHADLAGAAARGPGDGAADANILLRPG